MAFEGLNQGFLRNLRNHLTLRLAGAGFGLRPALLACGQKLKLVVIVTKIHKD